MEEQPKTEEKPAETTTETQKEPAATESVPANSTTELTQEKKDQCK